MWFFNQKRADQVAQSISQIIHTLSDGRKNHGPTSPERLLREFATLLSEDTIIGQRVLAEQGGEFAQKPFRARRPMIFSAIRKRVDDLAYGLGDLVCPLLVEKPHDTNSLHKQTATA